jgi:putative endonuclease
MFYVYLLRCQDGSLYCGSTNNLEKRLKLHNTGRGSAYVKSRGGGEIVYSESFATLGEALRREIEVKKWSKTKKEKLVTSPVA